jgi:hypothetical protein
METYTFPEQKTIFTGKPFGSAMLTRVFEEIFRLPRPFTGFLEASGGGTLYFLFFLQSEPYAAGKFDGKKPFNISLTDFFTETFALPAGQLALSLHETDPVLLKSMLILLQDEPTAKAPVKLIDLEQIVAAILAEAGDALIVLEKERMFNFFFIKSGMTARPHFSDPQRPAGDDLSIAEQLLLYAFAPGADVTAHIYRDIVTSQSSDLGQIDRARLLQLAQNPAAGPRQAAPVAPARPRTVSVAIVAGPLAGQTFTAALPCTIGRKDCDILLVGDNLMSRRHARFSLVEGQIAIEDLGSTNGTLVNGAEVQQTLLTPDDQVTLGETSLKVLA